MRFFVFLIALIYAVSPELVYAQQITNAPTAPPVTPIDLMPPGKVYINTSLIRPARGGYVDRRIYFAGCDTGSPGAAANDNGGPSAGFFPGCNATNAPVRDSSGAGAFRIFCTFVKIAFDDPIVKPGQAGQTHGHAFYGNTTTNYQTDINRMDEIGNSSCGGGIINRTGYWAPFIVIECPVDVASICTATADHGRPIIAPVANFYYKSWDFSVPVTTWPPKGLRIIAGNANATGVDVSPDPENYFECWNNLTGNPVSIPGSGGNPFINSGPDGSGQLPYRFDHIPSTAEANALHASIPGYSTDPRTICSVMKMNETLPQCMKAFDMLDSPDHKSHMAHFNPNFSPACPVGYRSGFVLPSIEGLFLFSIPPALLDYVRLSSDYSKAGAIAAGLSCATSAKNFCAGVTGHMDWVNGWDQTTLFNGKPIPQHIRDHCYPLAFGATYGRNCSDQVIGDVNNDGKNWKLAF